MKPIDEIKKENPFKVPDGYFESLTDRTMEAIKEAPGSESLSTENHGRKIRLMPFLALAAAIVGFAVLAAAMVRLVTRNENDILPGTKNEIYADLFTEEIDTYMIESEWAASEEAAESKIGVQSETIIDYLLLENIELTDIYEIL